VRNLLANDAVRPNCCACYYSATFVVFGAPVGPVERSAFFCRTYSLVMRVIREKHVNVLVVCNEPCVIGPLSLVRLIGHSGCPGIGEITEPGPAALACYVGAAHWPACLGGPGSARPGAGAAGAGGAGAGAAGAGGAGVGGAPGGPRRRRRSTPATESCLTIRTPRGTYGAKPAFWTPFCPFCPRFSAISHRRLSPGENDPSSLRGRQPGCPVWVGDGSAS
jgi:hypothetical protein